MVPTKNHWLLQHVENLGEALAANVPGREREWAERVSLALAGVEPALRKRIATPQATNGLSTTLEQLSRETTPTLARRVKELAQEQLELLERLISLRVQVQNALEVFQLPAGVDQPAGRLSVGSGVAAIPDFGEIRQNGELLLGALRQHGEAEMKLVLETATTDVGVGD